MNKRGQFYLIAALVIILIVGGFLYVYTKADAPDENLAVYDLSEEIDFEANQIIDNGVYRGLDNEQIALKLESLITYYSKKNPDAEIRLIYGDTTKVFIISEIISSTESEKKETTPVNNKINLALDEKTSYDFELRPNTKNLFVVVRTEKEGERTVIIRKDR